MHRIGIAMTALILGALSAACTEQPTGPQHRAADGPSFDLTNNPDNGNISALGLTADAADLNTPQHTKLVEPFTEPLTNPCNGEVIVFSGEAISHITDVGGLHSELQGSASGTGTGPESGATYAYNLVFHESFNTPSVTAPQANFFANANARVSSNLPDLNFTAHFVFHGVALPSGEFKVSRNLDRVECKA